MRANISSPEATFWYNMAPVIYSVDSAPSTVLFNRGYQWRNLNAKVPEITLLSDDNRHSRIGDTVFVKPAAVRCTTQWPTERVTAILSGQAIEVDGTPRHIANYRLVRGTVVVSPEENCAQMFLLTLRKMEPRMIATLITRLPRYTTTTMEI